MRPRKAHPYMRPDWRERLQQLQLEKRYTDRALSVAAELNPSAVNEWHRKGKTPSLESIVAVAGVLEVPPSEFLDVEVANQISSGGLVSREDPQPTGNAQLMGTLQAGIWQEPGRAAVPTGAAIPRILHPDYAELHQYAWEVVGPSMNRVAPSGSYVIGVSYYDLHRRPQHNDIAVCERWRGDRVEYTVKRVRYTKEGIRLDPESDDPAFQESLWLSTEPNDEEGLVRATHLIIGAVRLFV